MDNYTATELVKWLKEYRLNLMSLMGQDDYVTGKLDVIKEVLDKYSNKMLSKEHQCKYIKRTGESCTLNNNCKYPNCK